jgi:two-component system, cell cycle response regulator
MENQITILIVDDESGGRESLEGVLFSQGYNLVFAENGNDAYKIALEFTPDLILLDVMMPGMDGFETCRLLRKDPLLAEIPILMVTALDDRESRLEGIEAGADDFITKPYDRIELRARVRTITRLNRYRRLLLEKARFVWVVEHTTEGYLVLNGDDEVVYVNPAGCTLLNLPEIDSSSFPKSFQQLARQQYSFEPEEIWDQWQKGIVPEMPLYLIRRETNTSSPVWLQVEALELPLGDSDNTIVRITEVSDQIFLRQEMWSFNSFVSHKLRTPVSNMSLSSDLIQLIARQQGNEEILELSESLALGLKRLRSEVEDVLSYVHTPAVTRMGENFLLTNLPSRVEYLASNLSIENVHVSMDADMTSLSANLSNRSIEIILFELMENSKKFHPELLPAIEISASRTANNHLVLRIMDNGITLSPKQLNQVWLPYYQGEKYFTGEVTGMGLGLSTVASLIWQNGGKCRMYNREDQPGVVVELLLPLTGEKLTLKN